MLPKVNIDTVKYNSDICFFNKLHAKSDKLDRSRNLLDIGIMQSAH